VYSDFELTVWKTPRQSSGDYFLHSEMKKLLYNLPLDHKSVAAILCSCKIWVFVCTTLWQNYSSDSTYRVGQKK